MSSKEKRDAYKGIGIFLFVFGLWGVLLILGFVAIFFFEAKIEYLNNFGGFMNISTSLVGVATIFLLSKAIMYQKKELRAMKKEMKSQRKSIENEERINRTIKYIDEWVTHYDTGDKFEFTKSQKMYITRLSFLFFSEAKSKIDFRLLSSIVSKYGLTEVLNNELKKLTNKKRYYERVLKNNDFDEEELANAREYLVYAMDRAIEQDANGEEISYTEEELKMSPEESVRNSVEKSKTSTENKLKKLQLYIGFMKEMSKE